MSTRIFIDGEAGTTGLQIRDRLLRRRDLELMTIPDHLRKDRSARQDLLNKADVAILCLPDDAARESVSLIGNGTTRVIDASTAHRIADGWTYGFAEMTKGHDKAVAGARFVANPGCYPQGLIALVRPLIEAGYLASGEKLSYHGLTGYSGGGRKMIEAYEEKGAAAEPATPYGLTFTHKHLPEMVRYSLLDHAPVFTPVIGNFAQGMLTTVPLHFDQMIGVNRLEQIHDAIAAHFAGHRFVTVHGLTNEERLADLSPQQHIGTNRMSLYVFGNEASGQVLLMAVYDNLGKGASGAAVQNLNLMLGIEDEDSLLKDAA